MFRGEEVWFGVGTFGTEDDVMRGLGNCYRLRLHNTGHLALFSKLVRRDMDVRTLLTKIAEARRF